MLHSCSTTPFPLLVFLILEGMRMVGHLMASPWSWHSFPFMENFIQSFEKFQRIGPRVLSQCRQEQCYILQKSKGKKSVKIETPWIERVTYLQCPELLSLSPFATITSKVHSFWITIPAFLAIAESMKLWVLPQSINTTECLPIIPFSFIVWGAIIPKIACKEISGNSFVSCNTWGSDSAFYVSIFCPTFSSSLSAPSRRYSHCILQWCPDEYSSSQL